MLQVKLIGIGPGSPRLLTQEAREAIASCTILCGDQRMLAPYAAQGKQLHPTIKLGEIQAIAAAAQAEDVLGILVSGDVGFYSLAQTLKGRLSGCACSFIPGISSLVYFAAKIGLAWEDAYLVSMHGRQQKLVEAVATQAKVFALTGGANDAASLCRRLTEQGLGNCQVYVGERLSYPEERITVGRAEELAAGSFASLAVLFILNPAPLRRPPVHGLPDELFLRGQAPMTKQEVRSVALSKLSPGPADLIYDIGAGTGSCSIELARLAPLGRVYALERKAEALALLQKNIERFGCDNIQVVAGEALEQLPGLLQQAVPQAVFIGGSGGGLPAILDLLYQANPLCRTVVTAITVETLAQVAAYCKERPQLGLDIVQLTAARGWQAGPYHLLRGENPVFILTLQGQQGR